jgi:hypothetical protein
VQNVIIASFMKKNHELFLVELALMRATVLVAQKAQKQ